MSLTETLSPTPERLRKGDHIEAPEYSPTTRREAYRAKHTFEALYDKGRINEGCKEAGMKLVRHHEGQFGADVRVSESDWRGDRSNDDHYEHASIRHGGYVAEARNHLIRRANGKRMWDGLLGVAAGSKNLDDIGTDWLGCKNRGQAYIAGLALISQALEELSVLWGFSQAYHHSNPPSR
jgi:hypothetical protein